MRRAAHPDQERETTMIKTLVEEQRAQFLIATHSPILMDLGDPPEAAAERTARGGGARRLEGEHL